MALTADIAAKIAKRFRVESAVQEAAPHGSGHINASFRVRAGSRQYLLQRVNTNVFRDVPALMENIGRVTQHLHGKAAGQPDADRRTLSLVPALDGAAWHTEPDGSCWRMFHFIARAHSDDSVGSPQDAARAAEAFGRFQQQLADLPAPRLRETIPGFHDTPQRFRALQDAITTDICNRAAGCQAEIDFLLERAPLASVLLEAGLPERVTHNDTKLNNVLFDDATGEALCVVDLDTVMPGLSLYDFGDMVRTATSSTTEDEQDLAKVHMQMPYYRALVEGYLHTAGGLLTREERTMLPFAGKLIALEQAARFLSDYLQGDVYYPVTGTQQNLYRCRTQIALLRSMEQQAGAMEAVVNSAVCGQSAPVFERALTQ